MFLYVRFMCLCYFFLLVATCACLFFFSFNTYRQKLKDKNYKNKHPRDLVSFMRNDRNKKKRVYLQRRRGKEIFDFFVSSLLNSRSQFKKSLLRKKKKNSLLWKKNSWIVNKNRFREEIIIVSIVFRRNRPWTLSDQLGNHFVFFSLLIL